MTRSEAENRTYHFPDDERMRHVLNHSRGLCVATNLAQSISVFKINETVRNILIQLPTTINL